MSNNELKQIGPYEIRGILGKGGMAIVYRAFQANLNREVAIKVLSSRFLDDKASIERFRREALAVASLHHPNILTVYDTGQYGETPFIVTEYLTGKTLRERMGQPMELGYVSRILNQIAGALDYAHENGIVHRDIKPSNVLFDNRERPVISDFGIVKLLNDRDNMHLTATGVGVGTPEYMSPEQGMGESLDGRSDQYSLGVMVYEMLTGVTPFRADTPLAVLMAHVSRPLPEPGQFNVRITPEISAVLKRVLSKSPSDRYKSCGEFALAFEKVIQPPTLSVPVVSPISPDPTLQAGPVHQPKQSEPEQQPPTMPLELVNKQAVAGPSSQPALPYVTGSMQVADSQQMSTHFAVKEGGTGEAPTRFSMPEQKPITGELPTRLGQVAPPQVTTPIPAANLQPVYNQPPVSPPMQPPDTATPPARKNTGLLVGLLVSGVVLLISAIILILVLAGAFKSAGGESTTVAVTTTSVTTSATTATTVTTATETTTAAGTTTTPVTSTAPATTTTAQTTAPLTTIPPTSPSLTQLATLSEHTNAVPIAAWSPDGKILATGSWDNTVKFWNAQGKPLNTLSGHTGWVVIVSWSPNGKMLATGSTDSTVRLWRDDGSLIATLTGHTAQITNLAWSPDGKYLATAAQDSTVRIWNADGQPVTTLTGHSNVVVLVAWSPDSKTLASGSWDKTIKLWGVDGKLITTLNGHTDQVSMIAWSPDGKVLASASKDKTVRLWESSGNLLAILNGHSEEIFTLSWSPDSKYLASSSEDKTIRLWSEDGKALNTLKGHTGGIYTLAWSPDSKYLASGSADKTIRIWNPDGKEIGLLSGHTDIIVTVVWSPDGKTLVSCSYDKTARLWKI
jgi:WD40 repeat protein/serine/threonine protein kinase